MKRLICAVLCVLIIICASSCSGKESASFDFLAGKTVGIVENTTSGYRLAEYGDITVRRYMSTGDAAAALKANEIDAIVLNRELADEITKKNSGITKLTGTLPEVGYRFAMAKEYADLKTDVDAVIKKMSDAEFEAIVFSGIKSRPLEYVTAVQSDKTIKIALTTDEAPLCYDYNGELFGINAAAARFIAQKLNINAELVTVSGDELIPLAKSGGVQMSAGRLTGSAEDSELVIFSEIYYTDTQVILVRK